MRSINGKIKKPFMEIGIKNYLYGDDVLKLALAADQAAEKYEIDVLLITPYVDIRRVAEHTSRIIVVAPYMDLIKPGRGMADILPEALKAAGAKGVVLNHCERPMTLSHICRGIHRARELGMFSFVCADTLEEVAAVAQMHPDIINPEPTELIGTGMASDVDYMKSSIQVVKQIDPYILVEQAASISTGEQVYEAIMAGADGVGAASGICTTLNPGKTAEEMIQAVRMAKDDLQKQRSREVAI